MRPRRSAYPYRLPSLVRAALPARVPEEEPILREARLFAQDVRIKKARRPGSAPAYDRRAPQSSHVHAYDTYRASLALRSCTSGLGARESLLATFGWSLGLGNVPVA